MHDGMPAGAQAAVQGARSPLAKAQLERGLPKRGHAVPGGAEVPDRPASERHRAEPREAARLVAGRDHAEHAARNAAGDGTQRDPRWADGRRSAGIAELLDSIVALVGDVEVSGAV